MISYILYFLFIFYIHYIVCRYSLNSSTTIALTTLLCWCAVKKLLTHSLMAN